MAINNTLKQVNAVSKTAKADGEQTFTSALNDYRAPALTPELAWRYSTQNVHLRNNLVNMQAQVFPGEPEIIVVDKAEREIEDASAFIQEQWYSVDGYTSMQRSWLECMVFGCSVKSPGYAKVGSEFRLIELRDLPAITFSERPLDGGLSEYVANGLMPGIVIDKNTGETRAFQTVNGTVLKNEIKNFVIIKDPTTPDPAGLSYCLPIFPIVSAIDNAYKALNQQVTRVGAPLIFPQLTSMSTDLKTWGEQFVKRWGKNVGFILPPGVQFANPMIHESTAAGDSLKQMIGWIDGYFNPTTVLKKTEGSIGGTDLGALAVWNNFIGGQQAWVEYAYEQMLNPVLEANGYTDVYVQIRLKRPTIDRTQSTIEQLKVAVAAKAITRAEVRKNLPDLELVDWNEEIEEELDELYKAASANPFGGGFSAGQEEGQEREMLGNITQKSQVDKEKAFLTIDQQIMAAIRKSQERILKAAKRELPNEGIKV